MLAAVLAAALVAAVAVAAGGCYDLDENGARSRYNEALGTYHQGDWEAAAEGFLAARDQAGPDSELRYRAAFNLGLSQAQRADALDQAGDVEGAIARLDESAAWFRDAVRLREDDQDARVNLELVLRRAQLLADRLNGGARRLETRLAKVIDDQRELRDQVRGLMQEVVASGEQREPVAFQGQFDALATRERGILAEVGTISDLAGEEMGLLQDKEERSQEEEVRLVSLQNLDVYLQRARADLADTRRLLRRLQGDSGHRRADAGLATLKRAREQLQDPVTVLRGVAQEQAQLLGDTAGLYRLGAGDIELGAQQAAEPALPAWLTHAYLEQRQRVLEQRGGELSARFQAGVSAQEAAPEPPPGASPTTPTDPRAAAQQHALAMAGEAIPFLDQATEHMAAAATALADERAGDAAVRQVDALEALATAIERFSDVRGLIELVYRDHGETQGLLAPPGEAEAAADAELSASERVERILSLGERNRGRLDRLGGLFESERAALEAQAAAAGDAAQAGVPGGAPGGAPGQAPSAEELQQRQALLAEAERLRGQIITALTELDQALGGDGGPAPGQVGEQALERARAAATAAMGDIEALRRLYYSFIEHLAELLQHQTDTHDRTASAAAGPDDELASRLGPLVEVQRGHAAMGAELAQILAQEADAAAAGGEAGSGQIDPERLAEAAREVADAATAQQSAADFLDKDATEAATMSVDISPTLEAQRQAMAHLEEALRLLQPPQQQQDQQQQDQQDQQQQDQQQQQQQQQAQQGQDQQQAQDQAGQAQQRPQAAEEMSRQQAQRRLQEIRDRDAERRRRAEERRLNRAEPVEKDW
ncbi:hypothetical protein [Haliangium sp.]|uniref:hypothetical protein n=1 Tax=Haliangium sp. TaxID=2663208 RepID=UPI003D0B46D6